MPNGNGSSISLAYTLFKSVNLLFGFWFFILFVLAIIALIDGQGLYWLFVPVFVQLCSYALVVSRFKKGIVDSRKDLMKLLM